MSYSKNLFQLNALEKRQNLKVLEQKYYIFISKT